MTWWMFFFFKLQNTRKMTCFPVRIWCVWSSDIWKVAESNSMGLNWELASLQITLCPRSQAFLVSWGTEEHSYKLNTLSIYSPWFEQFTPYSILILGLCITSFRVCIISSISYVKKAQSYFKNLSYLYIHLLSRNFFVKYVLKEIPLF